METRKEIKFCLNFNDVFEIKKILMNYITPDKYCNKYGYYNINTKYICNIKDSDISGKFRLRTYNDAEFLEFKYKENKLKKKIRVKINDLNTYKYLVDINNSSDFIGILKKINFPIIPDAQSMNFGFIEIDYIREAYNCIYDNDNFRITFDYNIISSGEIINKDICIFEIKGEKVEKIEKLLSFILRNKRSKFSKYKFAKKHKCLFTNPFNELLDSMSTSKYFYEYMKYNMNYFLLDKVKNNKELYEKIQFLLYRQIQLDRIFHNIICSIPNEYREYLIGIKGFFIEQYYDVPRLYGDVDFIVVQGKTFKFVKYILSKGYSVKKYKSLPFYNNIYFLNIFKEQYIKLLHSFELQKTFCVCNENVDIEIDIQNKFYPFDKNKKENNGFLELDFFNYFLYLVKHIMQHLLFITPSEKNLQINLQKLYDLYIIVEKNASEYNERKLISIAKSKKMIPDLLYVLNIYTKVFKYSNVKFNINNILMYYNENECSWSKILNVSFKMNVSDVILGDFTKTEMYKLNEFLEQNYNSNNQLFYEFKCKKLLRDLNK